MRTFACLITLLACFLTSASGAADTKLRVGVFERAPFATKSPDGTWTGIAVAIWEKIAAEQSIPFEFVERPEPQALRDIAEGKLDVLIGEIAVSPERAREFHFSQPYMTFPAAMAMARETRFPHWANMIENVFQHGVSSMLIFLLVATAAFSILLWLVERRVESTHFGGRPLHGFGSALWFAAVTMTTVGYGDKTPRSAAGRLLVFIWMFFGVIVISIFTGMVASSIALATVSTKVSSPSDLARYHTGTLAGSADEDALADFGIRTKSFPTIEAGLQAIENRSIDAFVAGEVSLRDVVQDNFAGRITVAPIPNTRMSYALAMRKGLPQRDDIDVALIGLTTQPHWHTEVERFIGPSLAQ